MFVTSNALEVGVNAQKVPRSQRMVSVSQILARCGWSDGLRGVYTAQAAEVKGVSFIRVVTMFVTSNSLKIGVNAQKCRGASVWL
jgi:hypothetical protein